MSDDSPWQPPTPGTPDDGTSGSLSPWSREGAAADASPALPDPPASAAVAPPPPAAAPTSITPEAPTEHAPEPEPTPPSGGRRGLVVAVAACAIVAVGIAGIFAVRQFTGETAGGAESPEALAEEFLAALDGEDVLGIVDVLLPGEREALGEPMIDAVAELQRLEILSSDLDLSSLAGVDIQIESQTIAVEPRADDIVMLSMSADVLATIDGAEVPIGEMITDRVPDDVIAEMRGSKVTESDTIELAMAAVEHDGAWYLSLFYTVAELARSESGLGGVPTAGIGAVGADSPEGVIDLFADHLSTLDIRGMLQMLDPAEAEALQRYAPLFLDEAERAIADEVTGLDVRVTDREVRVEGDGSARTLFIDAIGVEADIEGTHVTASFADGCVSFAYEDEYGSDSMEQCASSPDAALVEQMAGVEVPPTVDDFITSFTEAFADMEPIGLEVRERDGQWYVSPIATGTEALLAVMRALDRDELDELIDLGSLAADDFFDMAFGLVPGMMDEGWTTEEEWAIEDAPADPPDSMDGTGDLEGEWTEYEASPVDECYSIESATEATACFEEQIATGAVDEWEMPVSLTAPECGLTEVLWSGDVYSMSDDEFTATMTAAAPCFEALLAEGYDRWLIPYEVANLECFEGRNPYQVFDEDYTDRLFECAYGVGDSDGA